ncbi:molybdopterin-binding protein [alpha proteobacterium AAP81b]|nr:molybdopterin-binding protein [alpha proteobacterium AAP81b]
MIGFTRRKLLGFGGVAAGGSLLAACDSLAHNDGITKVVRSAEKASLGWQRAIGRDALAPEYSLADLSPDFKVNGTHAPVEAQYQAMLGNGFADWRLKVSGLVANPTEFSLPQLKALPARTQITKHDCVEGWTAIGQWTGPQLGLIMQAVGPKPNARYVVFRCADNYGGEASKGGAQSTSLYYESIDLIDAFHPQTILAHSLNGKPLSVGHGAPLRLRVERQLGYKQAKYLMELVVTDSYASFGQGGGGYWEDRGYEWYAGI